MKLNMGLMTCLCGTVLVAVSGVSFAEQSKFSQQQLDEANNSYIFVLQDGIDVATMPQMASDMAQQHAGTVRKTFTKVLKGFSANMSAKAAERLAASNPMIAYYEKNGIAQATVMPADRISVKAAKSNPVDQLIPYGIQRLGGSRDGTGKNAWIIDTGIDLNNSDLNVGVGANFVTRGRDTVDDGNGHGTHVAGTIAARDNAVDVVGLAANATVHPVRVLDNKGSGYIDWIVAGIDYVAANAQAGDVANLSLGALGHYQSLHDAIVRLADLGIMVSVAAGNESDNANFYEPAHIEHLNVYTISAIDNLDVFAWFSNYGNPPIDFAAPGVDVVSNKVGGGVVSYSGTSMAAPHVAGLLLFAQPSISGSAINDPDAIADPVAYQ